ncbi:MAG TPA: gamma carbonic anhydrase family protein [Microbacteriaceae bacterium]|jgi:carbonic anhydrase/acetyltransferase-like protein (isoleucine patch superfamily)|nr:gamma carbonic anhydrase family protein [Microbacteriaceae bacterium]
MLLEHRGFRPHVADSAYVAPTAVLCGNVTIGEGARVLHGAVLTAEDGEVRIGSNVVVMENALVRGRAGHPAMVGDAVLIGPHAHVNGATVHDEVFIATGAALFPGSIAEQACELRVNAVLHANSRLLKETVLPIGWVAVGDPAQLFSPDRHEEIWAVQRDLDFNGTVYGVPAGTPLREIMARQSRFYGEHLGDRVLPDGD